MNIILKSFDTIDSAKQVWFMGSYALTVGTFILISGKLGDLLGLKLIFVIGWIWTTVFLQSQDYQIMFLLNFFIICRALQGIGFALLIPCGMGILGNIYLMVNGKILCLVVWVLMGLQEHSLGHS